MSRPCPIHGNGLRHPRICRRCRAENLPADSNLVAYSERKSLRYELFGDHVVSIPPPPEKPRNLREALRQRFRVKQGGRV